jgi:hypothetical protein
MGKDVRKNCSEKDEENDAQVLINLYSRSVFELKLIYTNKEPISNMRKASYVFDLKFFF